MRNPFRVIHFIAPAAGVDVEQYVNRFFRRGLTEWSAPSAASQPSIVSALADPDELLAGVDKARRGQLMAKEAFLEDLATTLYPTIEGESIRTVQISILPEELRFEGRVLPRGTVVYVRSTDLVTIAMETTFVVTESFAVEDRVLDAGVVQPISASPELPAPVGACFSLAQTLVWALSSPWGALAATGMKLVQLLFGKTPKSAIDASVKLLHSMVEVASERDHIQECLDWLNRQYHLMEVYDCADTETIETELLPPINDELGTGDGTLFALVDRLYHRLRDYADDYADGSEPSTSGNQRTLLSNDFTTLIYGVNTLLLFQKARIQLLAALSGTAYDSGMIDDYQRHSKHWQSDYAGWYIDIMGDAGGPGWCQKITKMMDEFEPWRIARIVKHARRLQSCTSYGSHTVCEPGGYEYYFEDTFTGYRSKKYTDDYDCSGNQTANGEDVRDSDYNAYCAGIRGPIEQSFDDPRKTVKQWAASINEWNEHMPPGQPTSKVELVGWSDTPTPHGSRWQPGARVHYAVEFCNAQGPSPYSEWSTHTIGDRAFPTLKIPTDPLGMATGRWLYRKFDNGNSEPIAYLPDNVQSQHTDSRD